MAEPAVPAIVRGCPSATIRPSPSRRSPSTASSAATSRSRGDSPCRSPTVSIARCDGDGGVFTWYDAANQPRFGPGTRIADLLDHGGNYSASCVGCHSTGIRKVGATPSGEVSFQGFVAVLSRPDDPGTFDYDGDGFDDLMNVGCESCHGAGGNYYKKSTMKSITSGEIDGATVGLVKPTEETCVSCHNEESPTFKGFDFTEYSEKISHPIPDAKKAEYQ